MEDTNIDNCIENCKNLVEQLQALKAMWECLKHTIPKDDYERNERAYKSVYFYHELNLLFYTSILQNDKVKAKQIKELIMNSGRSLMAGMEEVGLPSSTYVGGCDALRDDVKSMDSWIK